MKRVLRQRHNQTRFNYITQKFSALVNTAEAPTVALFCGVPSEYLTPLGEMVNFSQWDEEVSEDDLHQFKAALDRLNKHWELEASDTVKHETLERQQKRAISHMLDYFMSLNDNHKSPTTLKKKLPGSLLSQQTNRAFAKDSAHTLTYSCAVKLEQRCKVVLLKVKAVEATKKSSDNAPASAAQLEVLAALQQQLQALDKSDSSSSESDDDEPKAKRRKGDGRFWEDESSIGQESQLSSDDEGDTLRDTIGPGLRAGISPKNRGT